MSLEFSDGPEVKLENAVPGSQVVKTFKVKNSGSVETRYDVYFSKLINSFGDRSQLVYTLTSNDGGYNTLNQVQMPSTASKLVDQQLIGVGEEHNYTLTIKFIETNTNQNDNLKRTFSTLLDINKYEELASLTINISNGTVTPSIVYAEVGQHYLDLLPTPVPDKGYEFNGYITCDYQNVTSESYAFSAGSHCLIANIKRKDGYYYWNDNYSNTVYKSGTMPSNFELDYSSLINNNEPTGFIRTTVSNHNITKNESCLYYNNSIFCGTGGTYSRYMFDSSIAEEFKNDMAAALGETPTCGYGSYRYECSYGNASCFLDVDCDLQCGANKKYCIDGTSDSSGFGPRCSVYN